jgi:outer membrane receptor protein involved in Fe transport
MLVPGSPEFEAAVNAATNGAILTLTDQGAVNIDGTPRQSLGARIIDVSTVSTFEANYDFEDKIDFANLIVGGLVRSFNLDTEGTLYTDYDEAIEFNEFGVYAQMQKDLMDDNLSLTASMRYDKQDVMEDANITPRLGLLYKLSDNSNIRVSAQVGYRNPTNQDKFIGLFNGEEVLLGSTKENIDRFSTNLGGFDWTGNQVFDTALNKSSWDNGGNVVSESLDYVEAEKVTSYDIGYRYNSKDFTLDMNAYYSQYENFIGTNSVYVPAAIGAPAEVAMALGAFAQFGVDANLDVPFDTYGFSVEAIKRFSSMYSMNLIYEYNQLDYTAEANSDFELSWNTPEHRLKLGFTANLAENTSFSANARYNSEYYYESSFIDATIRENTVLDAKFMFAVPALDNLQFEVGGNNIAGRSYVSIPGSGQIGSLYYCGAKIAF